MREIQKAIIRKGDRYLILLRSGKAKHFPEHWDLPGGSLEEGEEPLRGIKREVFEETGLKIKNFKKVKTHKLVLKDEKEKKYRFTLYSTNILSGNVKISNEHITFKWATKGEMYRLKIEPSVKIFLDDKMNKKYVKVCPSCGSTEINFVASDVSKLDVCRDCRFQSGYFPEVEVNKLKEFKSKLKKLKE